MTIGTVNLFIDRAGRVSDLCILSPVWNSCSCRSPACHTVFYDILFASAPRAYQRRSGM